jgi:hypothetical protein
MFEMAMYGIVLQLVGEIFRIGGNIDDRDNVDGFAKETLVHEGLKHQTADSAESINSYFDCHNILGDYFS